MTLSRARYRERQILRANDLTSDQDYYIGMRWRHNIGPHGWGIVSGLKLAITTEAIQPQGLLVLPGLAVDGFGRELIVPEYVLVAWNMQLFPSSAQSGAEERGDIFDQLQSEAIDVWLVYGRLPETPLQPGCWSCGPDQHTRWREESRLRLKPALDIPVDPRRPNEVPAASYDFQPYETLPDDPDQEWPVYLGRIQRIKSQDFHYSIPSMQLPYVTLRGEAVESPCLRTPQLAATETGTQQAPLHQGQARMQVGSEAESDRRRFAVTLFDAKRNPTDRLVVDHKSNLTLRGDTVLSEKLALSECVPYLRIHDLKNPASFVHKLMYSSARLFTHLRTLLPVETQRQPADFAGGETPSPDLQQALLGELNQLLAREDTLLPVYGYQRLVKDLFDTDEILLPVQADDLRESSARLSQLQSGEGNLARYLLPRLSQELRVLLTTFGEESAEELYKLFAVELNSIFERLRPSKYLELVSGHFRDESEWPFQSADLKDQADLIKRLCSPDERLFKYLHANISPQLRDLLVGGNQAEAASEELGALLTEDLNAIVERLHAWAWNLIYFNRQALETAFPGEIVRQEVPVIRFNPPVALPAAARPRQIYRTDATLNEQTVHQLRIEIQNPGKEGDPARQQYVIGKWASDGKHAAFQDCLTVAADGTVTVHGNLKIWGQLVESPIDARLDDPRFVANQTAQQLANAMDTTNLRVKIDENLPASPQPGTRWKYTITLRNQSDVLFTDIEVYETLIVGGVIAHLNQPLDLDRDYLEPGDPELTQERSFDVPKDAIPGQLIQIVVTAIGIGVTFSLLYGSDYCTVPIQQSSP